MSVAAPFWLAACHDADLKPVSQDAGAREDAGDSKPDPDVYDAGEDDAGAAVDAARPFWQRSEVALEADGRSAALDFTIEAGERPLFALRSYASDAETSRGLCFQLEEVRADMDALWVPKASSVDYGDYCTSCAQRVAVGYGYGFFVLPSAAALPQSFGRVSLRIALRDCLTLSPLSPKSARPSTLIVESASYAAAARERTLALPLLIVEATPHTFTAGAELDTMFARVRETWRAAGIELTMRGHYTLARPDAPLSYSATDRASLSALAHAARQLAGPDSIAPLVLFTPCLTREDLLGAGETQPLAFSAHLPGGFAVHEEADAIFVAGERCGGLSAGPRYVESETLAAIVAHELGHYLGLFHVREADGREDALADTSPDQPNLMQEKPSPTATALAETQIEIARRHPLLAVERDE